MRGNIIKRVIIWLVFVADITRVLIGSVQLNGRALFSLKVSVYPKFDDFSKKLFFTFSDRSYCNLSFKKNSMKKD